MVAIVATADVTITHLHSHCCILLQVTSNSTEDEDQRTPEKMTQEKFVYLFIIKPSVIVSREKMVFSVGCLPVCS